MKSKRRGFTLVELLTVIAIIAILAAILLPVLQSAQRRARETACMSNLAQISTQLKTYKQDFKAYPPGCNGMVQAGLADSVGVVPGAPGGYSTFNPTLGRKSRLGSLYPNYIQEQNLFLCPEEEGISLVLAPRADPKTPVRYNWQFDEQALKVTGDPNFTSSTYDDYYNYFGYGNSGGLPTINVMPPAMRTRGDKMLANLYAPDDTVVTVCRKHERQSYNWAIIVRLSGGGARKVQTLAFDWVRQPALGN